MDESSGGVYLKFKPHTKTKWYRCNVDFSVFVTPGRPEGVGSCEPHPALSLLEWRGGDWGPRFGLGWTTGACHPFCSTDCQINWNRMSPEFLN